MKTRESLFSLRRSGILATAALLLSIAALPVHAVAVVVPTVMVTVDGILYDLTNELGTESKGAAGGDTYVIEDYTFGVVNEFSVTINRAVLDPDPSVIYGISVTDFGGASTFLFSFTTPIVSTGPSTTVSASLDGTLTDDDRGESPGVVSITDLLQKGEVGTGVPPMTNMGVDLSSLGATIGPKSGPSGTWSVLRVEAGFTLSGGGDGAMLNGVASINATQPPTGQVPEPTTLALIGLGLAGIGYRRQRGKRAA